MILNFEIEKVFILSESEKMQKRIFIKTWYLWKLLIL